MTRLIPIAIGLALTALAPTAAAEEGGHVFGNDCTLWGDPSIPIDEIDDYEFIDDPIVASWSWAPPIRVRPHPVRRSVLRPRLHFVRELCVSIEAI